MHICIGCSFLICYLLLSLAVLNLHLNTYSDYRETWAVGYQGYIIHASG
jgi:hypothetical protein